MKSCLSFVAFVHPSFWWCFQRKSWTSWCRSCTAWWEQGLYYLRKFLWLFVILFYRI